MSDVCALQRSPFCIGETQGAAILARASHLLEDARQDQIIAKPHRGLQLADIILLLEDVLPHPVLSALVLPDR